MQVILFETHIWQQLLPLTETYFLPTLPIGIFKNSNRISCKVIIPRLSTKPYSHLAYQFKDQICLETQGDFLIWNSSFIVDQQIINSIEAETAIFNNNGVWIALRTSTISDDLISDLYYENFTSKEPREAINCISIRTYEEVITGVQDQIEDDVDRYISQNPNLIEIQKDVFIHPSANIRPFVDFDTSNGKIVIGAETKITSFTLIEAPAFIGNNCLVTRAFVRPKTVIHDFCRVAGEISLTQINAYSNKSHDGCIALSYIGSWVNLGAGTECATLKYTYTKTNFVTPYHSFKTNMIGTGTIFCDHCTTGVGTILSPASIIGVGATLHEPYQQIPKYVPSFSWNKDQWDSKKFIETLLLKKSRRSIEVANHEQDFFIDLMKIYYRNS